MLVMPNFSHAREVGAMLNVEGHTFDITPVQALDVAQKRCTEEPFDVVLLSLSVLDSKFNGLNELANCLPQASILVLVSRSEQAEALQAIRHGADDCIVFDGFPMRGMTQTVLNVIHRKQLLQQIRNTGCEDATTGLYNLDGFTSMAQRLFNSCRQPRSKVYVVTFRVQGTEQNAITGFADALRATCRKAEITPSLCRVGLEEFALLASADSLVDVQHLLQRCEETFRKFKVNGSEGEPWSVEFGMAAYDPEYPATPAVVLERARQNWQPIIPDQPPPTLLSA
jgi:PleD family two-component response regulator